MKNLLFFCIVVTLCFSGCKKGEEPNPDLAATIDGTYTLTQVIQDSQTINLPSNGISGTITFTRQNSNTTNARFFVKQGTATLNDQTFPVYLSGNATNVELYNEEARTTKVGTATKSSVNFTVVQQGVTSSLTGSR
ncbi:hypothetical protein GCM10028807_43460 [Spirosoma daeguense]